MVKAKDAARYIISLDKSRKFFTKNLITMNGREFYEGNARLNKILHMAQNIYIGRCREKLIDADFYAYDNGGVIPDIQENYAFLIATNDASEYHIGETERQFLQKVFIMLKDAPIEELIEIDHLSFGSGKCARTRPLYQGSTFDRRAQRYLGSHRVRINRRRTRHEPHCQ